MEPKTKQIYNHLIIYQISSVLIPKKNGKIEDIYYYLYIILYTEILFKNKIKSSS